MLGSIRNEKQTSFSVQPPFKSPSPEGSVDENDCKRTLPNTFSRNKINLNGNAFRNAGEKSSSVERQWTLAAGKKCDDEPTCSRSVKNRQQLFTSGETRTNVRMPSTSSKVGNWSRNPNLDPGKDLWWDSTTDISSVPPSRPNSFLETASQDPSPPPNNENTKLFQSDTTVRSSNAVTIQDDQTTLKSGNDVNKASTYLQNGLDSIAPPNGHDFNREAANSNNGDGLKWITDKKHPFPSKYLTLSFVDVRKVKDKNLNDKGNIVEVPSSENPSLLSEADRGELADEDNAIVAVIPSGPVYTKSNSLQPSKSFENDGVSQCRIATDRDFVRQTPDQKLGEESEAFSTDPLLSAASVAAQYSGSLTSGVRSLPCSPFLSEWGESEPLLRSQSSGAIGILSESTPRDEKPTRVCTPHARMFSVHPFRNANAKRTFNFCLETNKDVKSESAGKNSSCFINAMSDNEQKLRCQNTMTSSSSGDIEPFVSGTSTNLAFAKPYKTNQKTYELDRNLEQVHQFSNPTPSSIATMKLKEWLSTDLRANDFEQKTTLHNHLNKTRMRIDNLDKTSAEKSLQLNKNVVYKGRETFATDILRSTSQNSTHESNIPSILGSIDNAALLEYIEKVANPAVPPCISSPIASSNSVLEAPKTEDPKQMNEALSAVAPVATTSNQLSETFEQKEEKFIQSKAAGCGSLVIANVEPESAKLLTSKTISSPIRIPSKTTTSSTKACVAHGRATSSIKTLVQQLIDSSSRTTVNPIYSPCLAALQATGLNRKRFGVFPYESVLFPSSYHSKFSPTRSISLPSSPKCTFTSKSLQKSLSLSDVFYDSTAEDSLLFKSKAYATPVFSSVTSETRSTNEESSAKQPDVLTQLDRKSTYVAYPLPTLTPGQATSATISKVTCFSAEKPMLADISQLDSEDSPSFEPVVTSSNESFDDRSPKLDTDVENELRKRAKVLIDSVKVVQHGYNLSYEDENVGNLVPIQAKQSDSGQSSTTGQQNYQCPSTYALDNNCEAVDLETLHQSTQTPERFLGDSDQKDVVESEVGDAKLDLPPKKPPRSKSPDPHLDDFKTIETKEKNSAPPEESLVTESSQPVTAPALFSYYPFFALGGSSTAKPHYVSPSLIPTGFDHNFLRGTYIPPISWYPLPCEKIRLPILQVKNDADFENSRHLFASNASLELHDGSNEAKTSLNTLQLPEKPRSSSDPNINQTADNQKLFEAPTAPYILIPYQTHSENFVVKPCHPFPTRRRSFSGISSSAAAKARVGRRNLNILLSKRPYMARPPKQNQANVSHPPAKRVSRRPRFVRSSLSDDTVYELVKDKKGSFMTKPAVKKVN